MQQWLQLTGRCERQVWLVEVGGRRRAGRRKRAPQVAFALGRDAQRSDGVDGWHRDVTMAGRV